MGHRSLKVIENGAVRQTTNDFLLVRHCNYSSVLYHFRVIWRWPWNLAYRSLKVIETRAIRKLWCGFLFAFHSNYGAILYRLRDIATYGRKSRNFYTHLYLSSPQGWPRRNFMKMFDADKTRMIGLPYGEKKLWQYVKPFSSDTGTFRTDRQTDRHTGLLYQ